MSIKFRTKTIVSAADVASEIISTTMNLQNNYGFALQCTFSGAPSGSVLVQGSNDGTNWSLIESLTISGTTVLASHKDAIYWPFVRAYKAAGGTGTMTVTITIKGA